MDRLTCDAVVVGAGVIGCSIAYELGRRGRDVVVVDRSRGAGSGSTSASSASIRFNYSSLTAVVTAWESLQRWRSWSHHLGAAPGEDLARYLQTGGLVLMAPVQDWTTVLGHFDQVGIPYEQWGAAEIRRACPWLDTTRHWPPKPVDAPEFWEDPRPDAAELSGIWVPDAGFVDDPRLAAQNLMQAARRHGVRFRFRAEVVEVPATSGRVQGVSLADGTALAAPVVVNASGPHSAAVNALAGVLDDFSIRTRPLRQEVHEVAAPPGYGVPGPLVADPDLGIYFRGTPSGRLIVGSTEPECDPLDWLDDADQADPRVSTRTYEAQVYRAARRLPELTVPGTPSGIAGVYDVTDDWAPIYDRTRLDGYYVAVGTSGNQFKNAPVVGELLTRLIEACESGHDHDREPLHVDLGHTGLPVDLGRYARHRPVGLGTGVLG
ncbi:FAD-binding oxidoreductase [Nocardioides sp. L-11A]|uniref:NAD(P)/FAD-dependent oxidoreductase n=1 Tax=Nocardioides sp. L-11A TaxID=3043848 RepID=UPI00249BA6F1|nr:FAD-dependent oxidoreductase [Nocardioides sp. L-11A]